MVLIPLTNNYTIEYQEVTFNVRLIRNQSEFKDLLYLTVNISTNF